MLAPVLGVAGLFEATRGRLGLLGREGVRGGLGMGIDGVASPSRARLVEQAGGGSEAKCV